MFKVYLVAQAARDLNLVFGVHDAQPCGLCARREKVCQLLREGELEDVVLHSHVRLLSPNSAVYTRRHYDKCPYRLATR